MKKRVFAIALIVVMMLCLVSCDDQKKESDIGFSIELPFHYMNTMDLLQKANSEIEMPENVCTYTSFIEGISVTAIKNVNMSDGTYEDLRLHEDYRGMTENEIAFALAEEDVKNSSQDLTLEVINGVPAIKQNPIADQTVLMFYYVVDGCQWTVGFVCPSDRFEDLKDEIISYADTIEFK